MTESINNLIRSLSVKTEDDDNIEYAIEFCINNDYVAFSYYDYDENGYKTYDMPSVCVIRRDYKKLYFINELYEDFEIYEKENISEDIAFGMHRYECYSLENNEIKHTIMKKLNQQMICMFVFHIMLI